MVKRTQGFQLSLIFYLIQAPGWHYLCKDSFFTWVYSILSWLMYFSNNLLLHFFCLFFPTSNHFSFSGRSGVIEHINEQQCQFLFLDIISGWFCQWFHYHNRTGHLWSEKQCRHFSPKFHLIRRCDPDHRWLTGRLHRRQKLIKGSGLFRIISKINIF